MLELLSKLPTRTLLLAHIRRALARAERHSWATAVMLIDLDEFHRVNGDLGLGGGDQVLIEVGKRLERAFRPSDVVSRSGVHVGRFAGDEFVVVCENVGAVRVAEVLGGRVAEALGPPIRHGTREVNVTAAVGIGVVTAAQLGQIDVDALLLQADAAMRQAKQGGHGQCAVLVDGPGVESAAEIELRDGFDRGELFLLYQPKVSLDFDRISGVEALVRWQHPVRGVVAPLDFIPLAERSGLIVPIGSWVIEEACRAVERWQRLMPRQPALTVSVNVSARQFDSDLVRVVKKALVRTEADPSMLCLEITESLLMTDLDSAVELLEAIADLGVQLSIDDFGTGYSSLAQLKRLPIHELKVDKAFVDGLGTDDNDTAIVAAVMGMAHAMDLCVVAEGVETIQQLDRLRTLGCEHAQGYHFSRPVSQAAIDAMLAAGSTLPMADAGSDEREITPMAYRSHRVLVVDDTAEVRQMVRMSLMAAGFEVHEAADGTEGLEVAGRITPDCILLDVMMDGMTGLDACRALRADAVTADTPIVMLTARADAEGKVEAFASGADDYIVKPFTPRDLTSRVRAVIRRRITP